MYAGAESEDKMPVPTQGKDNIERLLADAGNKRRAEGEKALARGYANDVLKNLEKDAKRTARHSAEFHFEPNESGKRDVLTVTAPDSIFYRRAEGGEYQYTYKPAGCPASAVDRGTAIRILASETS